MTASYHYARTFAIIRFVEPSYAEFYYQYIMRKLKLGWVYWANDIAQVSPSFLGGSASISLSTYKSTSQYCMYFRVQTNVSDSTSSKYISYKCCIYLFVYIPSFIRNTVSFRHSDRVTRALGVSVQARLFSATRNAPAIVERGVALHRHSANSLNDFNNVVSLDPDTHVNVLFPVPRIPLSLSNVPIYHGVYAQAVYGQRQDTLVGKHRNEGQQYTHNSKCPGQRTPLSSPSYAKHMEGSESRCAKPSDRLLLSLWASGKNTLFGFLGVCVNQSLFLRRTLSTLLKHKRFIAQIAETEIP